MINNHYGSVNSEIIPNNKKIYRTAEKLWTLLAHESWGPGFKVGEPYSRTSGWGPDKYNNLVCTCLIKKQRYFSNIDFNFIQFIWNTNDANFGLNKLWNKKRSKLSCNSKGGNSSHEGIHLKVISKATTGRTPTTESNQKIWIYSLAQKSSIKFFLGHYFQRFRYKKPQIFYMWGGLYFKTFAGVNMRQVNVMANQWEQIVLFSSF